MKNLNKITLLPRWLRSGGSLAFAFSLLLLPLTSCEDDGDANPNTGLIQPTGPPPAYAPSINPQMLAVLEQYTSYGTPPLPTLSPRQARMAPSVTDAVQDLLKKNNRPAPIANVTVSQKLIPGSYTPGAAPDGILVRIYTPTGVTGPLPVVVYYHGGGWVIGSLDVYEPSAKALAENTGAIVVNVDYRLSPEAKFPAAHEDSYAAYKWVRDNAASFGGNPAKVAVAGESAGGNLAVAVALLAKERSFTLPAHILSVYPIANNDTNTPSYQQYAMAMPLNKPGMEYFFSNYLRTPADGNDRLISLVDVADLRSLPATTIIAAEIDPLQTEGRQLADKLTQVGVANQYMLYPGTTHEFFGTFAVVPPAQQAQQLAANRLKEAFR
ncbi:alpha/beta hydrolase [Hymenobacter volaticus]|uniref:Alpha/beta hydrolase n=1 Tax=Hymenobacter volaticus TaxID=2932254 RepID=A0ABY4GFF0_9BACT|nr:alpha/beta hydrolase [Hymenobacter volaticus]UOQ69530.1 alpha/beta hydrolase [Hymenobacter volaticus]